MKKTFTGYVRHSLLLVCAITAMLNLVAQTDLDGIMMNKNQICNGVMYNYASWDHYWEGTLKRSNENLGTVSTQAVLYGVNYGITDKLNVMVMAPYVWTRASAGTFHGLKGIQDISVFVKWKPVTRSFGSHKIALFATGGFSTPLSDYVIDLLPFSLGLGSTNLMARVMAEYQKNRFTVSGSATYVWRSNIHLDRDAYYDTELHLTNEVKMPHASQFQLRTGYRGKYLVAEALLTNWTTLGGFDITRNNMPFPSNRMNATTAGLNIKYTLKSFTHLSLIGGAAATVAGRNVGQTTAFNTGIFYAFYFKKKSKS